MKRITRKKIGTLPEGTIVDVVQYGNKLYVEDGDNYIPVGNDEVETPHGFKVSGMECYAGKWWAQVLDHSPDIHNKPGVYCQFVEGCGYHVYTLNPDEAELLAAMLLQGAAKTRAAFAEETTCSSS